MDTNTIFKNKKIDVTKLVPYGFFERNGHYFYTAELYDKQFLMTVEITKECEIETKVIDKLTQDVYTLHLAESACGAFVGRIRAEYEKVLTDICNRCCYTEVFKSEYAKKIIEFIRERFGDELEYLWEKFPNNAVARRQDNKKWYLALLTVSRRKLDGKTDEPVEIVDLRCDPELLEKTVDNKRYFPGYHMNKKHWITVCLDGSVSLDEIFEKTEVSYSLAKK